MSRALRTLWYAAMVLGGAPTAFGAFQALSVTESPMRLTLLLLWSTRVAAEPPPVALGLLRGVLVAALVALTALLLVRLLGWAARRARRARASALESHRSSSAPARSGAGPAAGRTGSGQTARRPVPAGAGADPQAGPAIVVVVSAVTGTVGRARLGGRVWTVRSANGRLRDGERCQVVARQGEDLVVLSP